MRRRSLWVLIAGVLLATMLPGTALGAREPVNGEWSFKITRQTTDCSTGSLVFNIQSHVHLGPNNSKTYYQIGEIKFQGKNGRGWNTYDHHKVDRSRFTGDDLPTWSTFADRTQVGSSLVYGAQLRAVLTVWLTQVRPGPDKTVWKAATWSPQPTCSSAGAA